MTLEEIIQYAIPITAKDCRLVAMQKEQLREKTKLRLLEWLKEQQSDKKND